MEKLNMKYDRLTEILDVCNLIELDSIDLLLGYVKKYDLQLINRVYNNLYQQKRDKYRDEFEGINEYNWDISIKPSTKGINISRFDKILISFTSGCTGCPEGLFWT